MNGIFSCPICKSTLFQEGNSLKCISNHCFDISSFGYVNLAVGKNEAGDSAEMCRGRHEFLGAGYYKPFADEIARVCSQYNSKSICDAGCGEGYYLRTIKENIPYASLVGLDLAKTSIKLAGKEERNSSFPISYAVAGIFDMPLPDASFDTVLSVFAPIPEKEAKRILKDDGILIVCHPGKDHLMGLKRLLYENAYDGEEKFFALPSFKKLEQRRVRYKQTVKSEHINSLFLMTPYYWKTSKSDAEKLKTVKELQSELDFIITVYKKS